MLPNKSTPPKAETDLPLGRARIPANWSLQLVPILATRVRVQHATSLRYLLTPFPVYLTKDGAPMVCEILVALQGRVDAARLFGDRLEQIIFKLGGTRSTWDPKTSGKSYL